MSELNKQDKLSTAKIKITLDSENRENNKIIINDVDMTDCLTRLQFDWSAEGFAKLSTDYICHMKPKSFK